MARKKSQSDIKGYLLIIGLVLIFAFAIGWNIFKLTINQKSTIDSLEYQEVDISQIEDGVYRGTCDIGTMIAQVEVTVKEGHMTQIDILKNDDLGGRMAEDVTQVMIEQNKIDVETSKEDEKASRVIKMAVYLALTEPETEEINTESIE